MSWTTVDWPTAWRDLSTGDSRTWRLPPNGAKRALAYLRELEQVEQGSIFVGKDGHVVFRDRSWHIGQTSAVTIADDYGTGLPFADIVPDGNTVDAIRNAATITWAGGTVTDLDQTSVDAYGPGEPTISSDAIATRFDAEDLARWIIRLGKDPRTRITRLTILPRRAPDDIYPELLALGFGIGDHRRCAPARRAAHPPNTCWRCRATSIGSNVRMGHRPLPGPGCRRCPARTGNLATPPLGRDR